MKKGEKPVSFRESGHHHLRMNPLFFIFVCKEPQQNPDHRQQPPMKNQKDIFISYSTDDLITVKEIVKFLEGKGYPCFFSYRDIPIGTVWASAIAEALENCRMMVAVYTDSYNQSFQVDREIELCCDTEKKPVVTLRLSDNPMKGAKKFFLNNLNWINASTGYENSLLHLLSAIEQNIGPVSQTSPEDKSSGEEMVISDSLSSIQFASDKFICYIGRKVTPDMIYQAVGIDNSVYSSGFQGVYETCLNWWKKNPDIYVMIEDCSTKRVVGYINAMPLSNEYYLKIRSGETIDIDLPCEEIENYDFPDTYKMYFASIAIHPDYHNTSAFKVLLDGFMFHMLQLYNREIYFSSILADAVSAIGQKMCRYMGLTHILDTNHGSKIYEGSLIPPTIRPTTSSCKRLMAAYSTLTIA